jgi:hypothetical protein
MVFGVGLLIVGRTWIGLGVLGVGALVLAVAILPTLAGKAIAVSIGALICGGAFAYHAASNEITGQATYQPGIRGKLVTVTRQDAPAKFRQVTNLSWGLSVLCLAASAAGFVASRKLDSDAPSAEAD